MYNSFVYNLLKSLSNLGSNYVMNRRMKERKRSDCEEKHQDGRDREAKNREHETARENHGEGGVAQRKRMEQRRTATAETAKSRLR